MTCTVPGCSGKLHSSNFYCAKHGQRMWDHKRVDPFYISAEQKFWSRVVVAKVKECWLWTGAVDSAGYGNVSLNGKVIKASRMSYQIAFGEIPAGKIICHRCDNPPCVNPNHLFLGTHKDNSDDKMKKGRCPLVTRTHCKNGHEFTPENTTLRGNTRICRQCSRRAGRKFQERKRAQLGRPA